MRTRTNRHRSAQKAGAGAGKRALWLAAGITALIAPVLIAPGAFAAAPDGPAQPAERDGRGADAELTLDEAIALGLEESAAARIAELDLEDARISYEQAKASNLLQGSSIALATAESAWEVARRNYDIALQELKGTVEEAYYGVLRAQYALGLAEQALLTAERRRDVTEAELDQGLISHVELLTAESELAAAEASYESAQVDLIAAQLRFNETVGLDFSSEAELADEFTYGAVPLDLQTFVESALANRVELLQARDALERSEQELQTKQNDYTPELEKQTANNARERAVIALRQQKTRVRVDVLQKFHAVESARATIALSEQQEAIAEEQLRIARLQRDAGLLTDLEVLDAERTYQQAQTDSLQSVFDYNVALLDLYRAAGMERP